MSRILNRPMFRGGGKVSSYGNGIATGLADGGRVNLDGGGFLGPDGNPFTYNKGAQGPQRPVNNPVSTRKPSFKISGYPNRGYLPSIGGARGELAALRGLSAGTAGYLGLGAFGGPTALAYLNRAKTDEGLKVMRNEPSETFDETGAFDFEDYSKRLTDADELGNEISFMDNIFLNPESGTYPKFIGRAGDTEKFREIENEINLEKDDEKDDSVRQSDAELRAQMENKRLTKLLNDFTSGSKKKDTKEEAVAAIKERQELMEEVMGGGKSARIADASDIAINFAKNAFKEGATVKSAFAGTLDDESTRPSRSQKIKDAAANAAIQSYLTEQISEKDFSKQMQLITGQAQIKQKFANAAKSNLTVQDYVTNRSNNTSKSEAIENGARGIVQNNDRYKGFTAIDSEDNIPGLLVKKNLGEVFLDKKTKEVFAVIILEDGTVGKEILYN